MLTLRSGDHTESLTIETDENLLPYLRTSVVAVVEFSDPVQAQVLMSYGNATDPSAPGVREQLALASAKQLRPALRTRAEVEANLAMREELDWSSATP